MLASSISMSTMPTPENVKQSFLYQDKIIVPLTALSSALLSCMRQRSLQMHFPGPYRNLPQPACTCGVNAVELRLHGSGIRYNCGRCVRMIKLA